MQEPNKLRDSWLKWYHEPERHDRSDQTIADWWLEKMKEDRQRLVGVIGKVFDEAVEEEPLTTEIEGRPMKQGLMAITREGVINIKDQVLSIIQREV